MPPRFSPSTRRHLRRKGRPLGPAVVNDRNREEDDARDKESQADGGGNQYFADADGELPGVTRPLNPDGIEGLHHAHDRAEQAEKRRQGEQGPDDEAGDDKTAARWSRSWRWRGHAVSEAKFRRGGKALRAAVGASFSPGA